MKTCKQLGGYSQTVIALAVLAAFSPVRAQEIADLSGAGNTISVGVGVTSGNQQDRARFGMYNGLRDHSGNGLLGFNYTDRDEDSGKWLTFEGRNLGLDNRELGLSYRKLGDFKLNIDYGELVRHDPRTINTSMVGAGTTTPVISLLPTLRTGNDVNLETKRQNFNVIAEKWFGSVQMEVNFKNEDKNGARQFGRGFACSAAWVTAGVCSAAGSSALLLLPEPVDSNIKQLDARLNFSTEKLNLSGGLYASWYTNRNGNLKPTINGSLQDLSGAAMADANLLTYLQTPMALWPDNQATQLSLGGNYKLTAKTKLNFKYAYTHATQTENFQSMGLTGAPAGRSDLGGVVNSTKAQVGFSSHVLDKLHVHGDLKYDARSDKTPIARYNVENGNTFTNGQYSPKKLDGKLEASYMLPQNYTVTGGVNFENEDLGKFTDTVNVAGLSGLRQKLKERGFRLELRKAMSETLTGSLGFTQNKREGDSSWLKPLSLGCTGLGGPSNAGTGVIEANTSLASITTCATFNNGIAGTATSKPIFPFLFEDRKRDKIRAMANWTPMDRLDLTFFADYGKDSYTHPSTDHGLRYASMSNYSADAVYTLNDEWRMTAYVSRGEQETSAGHSTGYDAILRDINTSLGMGLIGKVSSRFQMGADVTYLNDVLKYQQTVDPNGTAANRAYLAASGGLPDVTYRLVRLKMYGEYALDRASYVRVDLVHQRTLFNEWTYSNAGVYFDFADNTTVSAKERQSVTFIGANYIYKFQ